MNRLSGVQDRKVLKIMFLVGDAPPHMDCAGAPKYPEICQAAMKRDLIIKQLNKAREDYITQERKRLAEKGKSDSFDENVAQTIRQQAARKGIEFGK